MGIPRLSSGDPGSYSNPDSAVVTHLNLKLNVDFTSKVFFGSVTLTVHVKSKTCKELILDTRDLHVQKVVNEVDQSELCFTIGEPIHTFGSKMSIELPKVTSEKLLIKIDYETSSKSTALQWLLPEQTAGGRHPYVFSQCQPDHCRSIIPCQDSSGVKITYSASITVPEEFTVLMSALKEKELTFEKNGKKTFYFNQPIQIPAYLIAIAVGNLESKQIGPRSNVWAEPEIVEKAAYEFEETELLLKIAESICGPYVWTIYDVLVLPPSFPFGGMENPCLTFITPTLLVGDRSQVSVIAHEISHSWTGNLISVKNFEHFWLNEGFTTFVERKINGRLKGEPYRHFCAIGGLKDLRQCVNALGDSNPFTKLVVDLTSQDPDDAFSTCPYEKGHTFLFYLEQLIGGADKFEAFLRSYFDRFKYQSLNTDEFKEYFLNYFEDNKSIKYIDWNLWLNSCGMPPIIPVYNMEYQEICISMANRWRNWDVKDACPFTSDDLKSLISNQVQEFCALLLEECPISVEKLKKMNELYKMNCIENFEIRYRWLLICIQSRWEDQVELALKFATDQGRMKFVRPIFRCLFMWEKTREKAARIFKENQSKMMHVLVRNLNNDYEETASKVKL